MERETEWRRNPQVARDIWDQEGKMFERMTVEGVPSVKVSAIAGKMGFSRSTTAQKPRGVPYSRGPCLECWNVRPRDQILKDRGWTCTRCAAFERVRQRLQVDLDAERKRYRERIRRNPERLDGLQKRVPSARIVKRGNSSRAGRAT